MRTPLLARHAREFLNLMKRFKYERTDDGGILFPTAHVMAHGEYIHSVNGQDERIDKNLIVDEGLVHMLNVTLGATAKIAAWYVALYAGSTAVAANWTAANFAATASEITSGTEGFSETTRRAWTPAVATTPSIDNVASKASHTIVTASQLNVKGAALLSVNTKGSTSGVLHSAAAFSATRVLNNGDDFQLGYRASFTST
jgi:hypothetical protein